MKIDDDGQHCSMETHGPYARRCNVCKEVYDYPEAFALYSRNKALCINCYNNGKEKDGKPLLVCEL